MNNFKTFALMLFLIGLFAVIGELLGGMELMIICIIIAMGINFITYWYSDKIVLATTGAKQVDANTQPRMARIVYKLCDAANLPHPKLYIIPQPMPNAFATGRDPNHAAVACTQGLLNLMDDEELEGVLAHELSHVKNRDILISTIAAAIAGAIMIFARLAFWFGGASRRDNPLGLIGLILIIVLAPLAAFMIRSAISRSREYEADHSGGEMSGNPHGLARALAKLHNYHQIPHQPYAGQASAHMYIYSPLSAKEAFTGMFSTHPPIPKRIEKLENQARGMR
jgi:heat shock protein HtpX